MVPVTIRRRSWKNAVMIRSGMCIIRQIPCSVHTEQALSCHGMRCRNTCIFRGSFHREECRKMLLQKRSDEGSRPPSQRHWERRRWMPSSTGFRGRTAEEISRRPGVCRSLLHARWRQSPMNTVRRRERRNIFWWMATMSSLHGRN